MVVPSVAEPRLLNGLTLVESLAGMNRSSSRIQLHDPESRTEAASRRTHTLLTSSSYGPGGRSPRPTCSGQSGTSPPRVPGVLCTCPRRRAPSSGPRTGERRTGLRCDPRLRPSPLRRLDDLGRFHLPLEHVVDAHHGHSACRRRPAASRFRFLDSILAGIAKEVPKAFSSRAPKTTRPSWNCLAPSANLPA